MTGVCYLPRARNRAQGFLNAGQLSYRTLLTELPAPYPLCYILIPGSSLLVSVVSFGPRQALMSSSLFKSQSTQKELEPSAAALGNRI